MLRPPLSPEGLLSGLIFHPSQFHHFGSVSPAAAQNSPEINLNEAFGHYPLSIYFQQFATHSINITSVTLVYGVNGRSYQQGRVRQLVDAPDSTTIFAFWEWELLQSGALQQKATNSLAM
jgi:hypothetical protein